MTIQFESRHTPIDVSNGRSVPKHCWAARPVTSLMELTGQPYIEYDNTHIWRYEFSEQSGPCYVCERCLIWLGPADVEQFTKAIYGIES